MKKVYRPFATVFVIMITIGISWGSAQAPIGKPDVVKLDPALDQVISTDAKLQLVKGGFGFPEGPNWVQHGKTGYLLFSDIPANVVHKLTAEGELSVYLDRSGYTGPFNGFTLLTAGGSTTAGPFIQLGTDGLALDPQGRLILCAFGDRALARLEKGGKRTVLADRFEGKRFNGPNDAVVKKNGTIYFSETYSGLRDKEKSPLKGLDYNAIFMIKDGKLALAIKDIAAPNGVALSPDEKYLYATDDKRIWRYEIQPDDRVTNRHLLVDMSADQAPGVADGLKVDLKGNVYTTGPGGIWIVSPEGKHLGTIVVPGINLTFGDPDWKSVYVAARGGNIFKIRVITPGSPCSSCS